MYLYSLQIKGDSQKKTFLFAGDCLTSNSVLLRNGLKELGLFWIARKVKDILRPTVSRPVCLGVRHPAVNSDQFFYFIFKLFLDCYGFVDVRRPLWWEVGSVVFKCCWSSPSQSFSGLSRTGIMIILYCLNFLDSPNLEGQIPVFISPRDTVAHLYSQALSWITDWLLSSQSQNYITIDGQSASLSCCQAPIWGPRSIFRILSLIIFRQLLVYWCGAPSLMRSRVCSFQFYPGIASAAFLRAKSHGTH
jgi:hypothetical protein